MLAISRRAALFMTAVPATLATSARAEPRFAMRALALRDLAAARGDQPYGAVVVRGGAVVGEAESRVVADGDPTAHAELLAIRDAARRLGTRDLSGCEMYGSARACPMCESAAYWARIARLWHGAGPDGGAAPRLGGCG